MARGGAGSSGSQGGGGGGGGKSGGAGGGSKYRMVMRSTRRNVSPKMARNYARVTQQLKGK